MSISGTIAATITFIATTGNFAAASWAYTIAPAVGEPISIEVDPEEVP